MDTAQTLRTGPTVLGAEPHGPTEPATWRRLTIFFHAPFDRVYALTSLGAMGIFLAGWATVTPVRIAGAIVAAVALPWAYRLLVRELKTPQEDRGVSLIEDSR